MAKRANPDQGSFTDLWPEWFSLGYGIKGWVVDFEIAEAWRIKSDFSEDYCLDKMYVLRAWWSKKHEKEGRDPYANFQRACREDWGAQRSNRRAQPSSDPKDFERF